ncbi:DUF4150 domain-containing protein [Gemmatimonadota bacterium]
MANEVFANGREVSCKAADGKAICAFPDVCFTPPQTPATPPGVPIPYPNTGMASDTTSGSKKVKISRKEVGLKNQSHFKKSTGDEAGSAPKKGVITSNNTGKVYFNAWSMDVKVEGKNIVRHLDLTTHNHMSMPGDTLTWPYVDTQAMASDHPCKDTYNKERAACKKHDVRYKTGRLNRKRTLEKQCADPVCQEARKCVLVPHKGGATCCSGQEGDHLVEVNCFTESAGRNFRMPSASALGSTTVDMDTGAQRLTGFEDYKESEAPVACVSPAAHRRMQATRDNIKRKHKGRRRNVPLHIWTGGLEESNWTYREASDAAAQSHQQENPQCNKACTKMQIDNHHHSVVPGATTAEKNSQPVRTYVPRR